MKPLPPEKATDDENPGVPGFRSWRTVYIFVFVIFILCVLALTLFSRAFA